MMYRGDLSLRNCRQPRQSRRSFDDIPFWADIKYLAIRKYFEIMLPSYCAGQDSFHTASIYRCLSTAWLLRISLPVI